MLVVDHGLQKKLFSEPSILDDDGFLSTESIRKIKEIARELKKKQTTLELMTGISIESWNNWLYKKRPPSGPSLAFLRLFLVQPDVALRTFEILGQNNEMNVMQ